MLLFYLFVCVCIEWVWRWLEPNINWQNFPNGMQIKLSFTCSTYWPGSLGWNRLTFQQIISVYRNRVKFIGRLKNSSEALCQLDATELIFHPLRRCLISPGSTALIEWNGLWRWRSSVLKRKPDYVGNEHCICGTVECSCHNVALT